MPQPIAGFNISDTAQINPGVIVNSDINDSAAIAYSKLNLALGIVNDDVAAGAAIVDTKLATISTAGKVSGAALTSLANIPAGAGTMPTANVAAQTGSWTFLENIVFTAETGTKSSTTLTAADLFLIRYRGTKSVEAGDQTIRLQLNLITAANYQFHQITDVTLARIAGATSILLHTCEASVGDTYAGEVIINGKHLGGEKSVALNGYTAPSHHKAQGIWGGILRSNSADVTSISIVASGTITGTFKIYSLNV